MIIRDRLHFLRLFFFNRRRRRRRRVQLIFLRGATKWRHCP
jgi:hypothetical protein